jgi:predicted DCC family thiol-disulfide oxidoreductase YuxK
MASPVLLYDGDCGFCTRAARFLERHIPVRAEIVAFQFADLDALGTTTDRARRELLWIEDGRVHGGARAVARLLAGAGGPWRLLGLTMGVPPFRWAAQGGYRLVAANRHRLPGGTPACRLPAAERPGARPSGT